MLAIMFLPRQFQVTVMENKDESHLKKAIWLFPLYMLAINVFVLPIAFGGLLRFRAAAWTPTPSCSRCRWRRSRRPGAVGLHRRPVGRHRDGDRRDIALPLGATTGDAGAAAPARLRLNERPDLTALLLGIRRGAIVLILLLGYLYFRATGEAYALVSIGLISFAAVAQFAPASWRYLLEGRHAGRRAGGPAGGFAVWFYTLLLPALARSGWLPIGLLEQGPFGIALLKPLELFGLAGLDQITHAMIWSMIANIGAYVGVSLCERAERRRALDRRACSSTCSRQASGKGRAFWRGTASAPDLLPCSRASSGLRADARPSIARGRGPRPGGGLVADADLVHSSRSSSRAPSARPRRASWWPRW